MVKNTLKRTKVRQNVFFQAEARNFDLAWRFAPCSMPGFLVADTVTLCGGEYVGIYKWAQSDYNDKRADSIAVSEADLLSVYVL